MNKYSAWDDTSLTCIQWVKADWRSKLRQEQSGMEAEHMFHQVLLPFEASFFLSQKCSFVFFYKILFPGWLIGNYFFQKIHPRDTFLFELLFCKFSEFFVSFVASNGLAASSPCSLRKSNIVVPVFSSVSQILLCPSTLDMGLNLDGSCGGPQLDVK